LIASIHDYLRTAQLPAGCRRLSAARQKH